MATRLQLYNGINSMIALLVEARTIGDTVMANQSDQTVYYQDNPDLPILITAAVKQQWLQTFDALMQQVKAKAAAIP